MITMRTAFTGEIDDPDKAAADILGQLGLERPLLRHSVGLIHCYEDFVSSGAARAVCAALPFEVFGCVALGSAVRGAAGMLLLTITVLSSDEVVFASGVSDPLDSGRDNALSDLYARLLAELPGKPSMCLLFAPFHLPYTGDVLVRKLHRLAGDVPFFGMRSIDEMSDHSCAFTLHNGEEQRDAVVLVALSGAAEPVFMLKNVYGARTFAPEATITAAEGQFLMGVNGIPALEYFSSLGMVKNGELQGKEGLCFVVDIPGGGNVARIYEQTTPRGEIRCSGYMPTGAGFRLSIIDPEQILSSAREIAAEAAGLARGKNLLIISCAVRNWVLGIHELAEMDIMAECLGQDIPYHFAYSGGEICPVRQAPGGWLNQFHNVTLVMCIL
ncbi:MAG: FIST C-terminal domain-containing protein [Desulfovibrio sp.]|jgi:hypothetical protein|nr:FIST C-terminal domain-containing protein [Desulfovibrio sp.]